MPRTEASGDREFHERKFLARIGIMAYLKRSGSSLKSSQSLNFAIGKSFGITREVSSCEVLLQGRFIQFSAERLKAYKIIA